MFGNSGNKKVEKLIKKLEATGGSREAYKTRKHCGICRHFNNGTSFCNLHGKQSRVAELCHSFYGK